MHHFSVDAILVPA